MLSQPSETGNEGPAEHLKSSQEQAPVQSTLAQLCALFRSRTGVSLMAAMSIVGCSDNARQEGTANLVASSKIGVSRLPSFDPEGPKRVRDLGTIYLENGHPFDVWVEYLLTPTRTPYVRIATRQEEDSSTEKPWASKDQHEGKIIASFSNSAHGIDATTTFDITAGETNTRAAHMLRPMLPHETIPVTLQHVEELVTMNDHDRQIAIASLLQLAVRGGGK